MYTKKYMNTTQSSEKNSTQENNLASDVSSKKYSHAGVYVVVGVGVLAVIVGALWFLGMQRGEPVTGDVIIEETQQPVVYSEAELQEAMNTPLPADQVVEYDMQELRETMDTALPEDFVQVYSQEELESAMGGN
jgi:hypothetical protein